MVIVEKKKIIKIINTVWVFFSNLANIFICNMDKLDILLFYECLAFFAHPYNI